MTTPPIDVCAGVGPTRPVSEPFATIQLIVTSAVVIVMLGVTAFFFRMRKKFARLRSRSVLPHLLFVFLGIPLILVRSVYDYLGREHFPCWLSLTFHYLIIPITITADMAEILQYLVLQNNRRRINPEKLAEVLTAQGVRVSANEELWIATPLQWVQGFYNYVASIVYETWSFALLNETRNANIPHPFLYAEESFRRVSPARLLSYEVATLLLFSFPFLLALGIRVGGDAVYNTTCMGCMLAPLDFFIILGIQLSVVPVCLLFVYRTRRTPDPLNWRRDLIVCVVMALPFSFFAMLLATLDPGEVMRRQEFDWYVLERIFMFNLFLLRTPLQLLETFRIRRSKFGKISLLKVLAHPVACKLFEKHLQAELANENYLFWNVATKYKVNYDRDLDYSQQMARVIYRMFLAKYAQLPLNIPYELSEQLRFTFKADSFVARTVFDEAMLQAFFLMEKGPFPRFLHSRAYLEFAEENADFYAMNTHVVQKDVNMISTRNQLIRVADLGRSTANNNGDRGGNPKYAKPHAAPHRRVPSSATTDENSAGSFGTLIMNATDQFLFGGGLEDEEFGEKTVVQYIESL